MARPTIGLALGGGVARGFVHIGVVKRLIAENIKPDIVTGTSIGAVVGGLYLAGHFEALEQWALSLTPKRVFSYADVKLGGNSLIAGEKLAAELRNYISDRCIENLDRIFVCVATELSTGHEVWMRRGTMADALRASYALPGLFPPVQYDGRWLVDGALVNPVPTSVARAEGARFVVAVSLHSDQLGAEPRGTTETVGGAGTLPEAMRLAPNPVPDSDKGFVARTIEAIRPDRMLMRMLFGVAGAAPALGSVMLSALNILLDRVTRTRLAGDPPDVLIAPRVGNIGLLDFHRAGELIQLGYAATDAAIPEIKERIKLLS